MRKVVKELPECKVVGILDFNENKYYGFQHKNGSVGILTRERFRGGSFKILSQNGTTYGNFWRDLSYISDDSNIKDFMTHWMQYGVFYEFDEFRELAKWLYEKSK